MIEIYNNHTSKMRHKVETITVVVEGTGTLGAEEGTNAAVTATMMSESHLHGDPLLEAAIQHSPKESPEREKKGDIAIPSKQRKAVEGADFHDPLLQAAIQYHQNVEEKHSQRLKQEHGKLIHHPGTIVGDRGWFFNDIAPIHSK